MVTGRYDFNRIDELYCIILYVLYVTVHTLSSCVVKIYLHCAFFPYTSSTEL